MSILENFKRANNHTRAQVKITDIQFAEYYYIFFNDYANRVELHEFKTHDPHPFSNETLVLSISYEALLECGYIMFSYLKDDKGIFYLWRISFQKHYNVEYEFYQGHNTIWTQSIKTLFEPYEKLLGQEADLKAYEQSLKQPNPPSHD